MKANNWKMEGMTGEIVRTHKSSGHVYSFHQACLLFFLPSRNVYFRCVAPPLGWGHLAPLCVSVFLVAALAPRRPPPSRRSWCLEKTCISSVVPRLLPQSYSWELCQQGAGCQRAPRQSPSLSQDLGDKGQVALAASHGAHIR